MFEDYFDESQHRFMNAFVDTLAACGWDENDARLIESECLDIWEYSTAKTPNLNLQDLQSLLQEDYDVR